MQWGITEETAESQSLNRKMPRATKNSMNNSTGPMFLMKGERVVWKEAECVMKGLIEKGNDCSLS
jgi:ribulose 1,5-bisphosphate synthetase/thiazole synthase